MIRNYFKIAWRSLQKNKLYTLVNLAGLSIGIVGCLLIGLYIYQEWSYGKFHEKAERIARVTWQMNFEGTSEETANTGTRVGPEFTRRFPEVEEFVRLLKYPRVIKYEDKLFEEKNFLYADSSFFKVFSFPLLKGNPATVLDAPEKVVLSSSMAEKYFGSEPAVGKRINVGGKDFLVTGIAADAPDNSQVQYDFVGSFTSLNAAKEEKWTEANYLTYLLLTNKNSFKPLQAKIEKYMQEVKQEEPFLQGNNSMNYHVQPLTKVHLYSKIDGFEPNGSITYLYVLAAMALLILFIACVNYTNMSIAQSAGRSSEIGMRKVLGAQRGDIFKQFITEAILLTLLAVVVGMLVCLLILPQFNELSGKNISFQVLFAPSTLLVLLVLATIITFLAGAYPALVLSGGKLTSILKKGYSLSGSAFLRKSLIVFQFVISIFLIISTVVILQQLSFIQNKDLGYSKEQLVILPVDQQMREKYEQLTNALENVNGISSVAGAYEEPTHIGWSDGLNSLENNRSITINAMPADENIVKTLDLTIIAGKDFTSSDIKLANPEVHGNEIKYTYILNESAVKAMGWTPEEAVGKRVAKGREGVVRAVVKDFHFRSLHEPIGPLVIFMDERLIGSMFVKISSNDIAATLDKLEAVWKDRVPHRPFEYQFLDESYAAMYKAEQSIAGIFTTFSLVAILLACLGLFALTAYAMVRRTKEIGIRKVLGASVTDILAMVSTDFVKLVIVAVLIAVPLSIFAVNKWLGTFSYRIDLQWWIIILASLITLGIATVTVCLQAFKTAVSNPVKNLKTE